ncbi:beta-Ig-H3/fasciclin [Emticicia oligotrophica DSM 17448]|uniref:Beta-Ig-H3/fasciclin n=2 Tax=Emticicia TaxID=312278 RepID=A0ABM5MWB6_EMTOG|nr:beta-Ig-H3/fasciclin [Emticicia oligotrophica DSM 17448]
MRYVVLKIINQQLSNFKIMKKIKALLGVSFLVSSLAFTVMSCDETKETPAAKDVVDVALSDSRFSTLTKLLTDNGLISTLKGSGPFTVFAPTNDAFAKIDASKLSKDELVNILKSHVLSGKVMATDVKSGVANSLGSSIYLSKNSTGVFINGNSQVTTADVSASNGVIHIIDNVIVPPTKNLVEIAQSNADFTELVSLVLAADASVLTALASASNDGLTVFAPTNAAFNELYKTIPKATLLAPENKGLLTSVLLYHVVPGRVFSSDLPNVSGEVGTANSTAKIAFELGGGAKVKGKTSGNSNIVAANILATNGVIHVIDKVLLP